MLFWSLLALMTGAAVFSVLWPLGLRRTAEMPGAAADIAVYRDQLAEIENDRRRGLLADSEAEAARVEIGRRLLGADRNASREHISAGSPLRRRIAALAALAGIPTAALLLYFSFGSPGVPDLPPPEARAPLPAQVDFNTLLARAENYLAEHPDDGHGWELLAPIYLRMGRTADAVKARANALRLLGETAERQADLGAALVMNANGVVTAEARAAFDRAVALGGDIPKVKFFLGLAAEQDGRKDEAEKIWRALAENAPPDAPWLGPVRAGLARLAAEKGKPK